MIRKNVKTAWIAALKNKPKNSGPLKDEKGYCPFGVLLEVVASLNPKFNGQWIYSEEHNCFRWNGTNIHTAPLTILNWVGLTQEQILEIIYLHGVTTRFDEPGGVISYLEKV